MRRKPLARVGIGDRTRKLPHGQLAQETFVELRHQLRWSRQGQHHQALAGLNDLTGLHRARQHLGIARRNQPGLRQSRPRGVSCGCRQSRLRLQRWRQSRTTRCSTDARLALLGIIAQRRLRQSCCR